MAVAPDGGDLYGAAVDDVVGTDDRRGGIGDEEADERGDLVGPGGAAQRPEGVHERFQGSGSVGTAGLSDAAVDEAIGRWSE
jgi:hypothetical protein